MATQSTRPAVKTAAPAVKPAPAAPVAPAVKPSESAASKASRSAPLDLAFLASATPVVVAAPKRAAGAGRKADDNTLVEGWLRDSWNARKDGETVGEGRGIPNVPLVSIGALKSRFNRAAATLKLGVSFAVDENKAAGTGTLRFVAKTRKQSPAEVKAAAAAKAVADAAKAAEAKQ